MSEWLAERVGSWLAARPTRRDVLGHATVAGAALATYRMRYLLRPGRAVELVTLAPSLTPVTSCAPSSMCASDGYTEFCCVINQGLNACPPGTIAAGWWKADGSTYCGGAARYYIDCNGTCKTCQTCVNGFCPTCDGGPACDCANGDCNNRRAWCRVFRYGRCHQEVACVGRLACRVVSCTPAWQLDPACTTVAATDNNTANHHTACLDRASLPIAAMAATLDGKGYWLTSATGVVAVHGDAVAYGSVPVTSAPPHIVGMARTPSGKGYWLAGVDGGVFSFGDAIFYGSMGGIRLNKPVVGMAPTLTGQGYWLVASDGGVFSFGDAKFYGSTGSIRLNKPIVGMAATPTGKGYWFVASDGGVFAFGDAAFYGSTGSLKLNQPIVGMAATLDGKGYWLVARDGGIFAFGDAAFYGSTGGIRLNQPIIGMATTPTGKGYWLVASDGGIFAFGDAGFYGSGP